MSITTVVMMTKRMLYRIRVLIGKLLMDLPGNLKNEPFPYDARSGMDLPSISLPYKRYKVYYHYSRNCKAWFAIPFLTIGTASFEETGMLFAIVLIRNKGIERFLARKRPGRCGILPLPGPDNCVRME
jgi:hypothetical protein